MQLSIYKWKDLQAYIEVVYYFDVYDSYMNKNLSIIEILLLHKVIFCLTRSNNKSMKQEYRLGLSVK